MAGSEHPFDAMARPEARPAPGAELQRVADLLGGDKTFGGSLTEPLEAHEKLLQGLPGQALGHLLDNLMVLKKGESLEAAVGMSLRTFQRRKDIPSKPLSKDQSGRAWKFAEILARATTVFGTQQAAEQWLERPAIGLNERRPIDLLATQAGVDVVEEFLARLEYGVYA